VESQVPFHPGSKDPHQQLKEGSQDDGVIGEKTGQNW
jgi:hypothetical protein